MADLGSLVVSMGADLGPLKRSTMQAETQFHKFQKSGVAALERVKKSVFSLKTVIGGLTVGTIIRDITKTKNEFVKYRKTLETLEVSQKAANIKWKELLQFAEETPFKINQVMESYKTLKAFGLDPTIKTMRIMGDTAAALGGSDVIGRIALVLGQIQAQGFMTAQDMNQLANAGINAGKVMKDTFGVARDKVAKLEEQGVTANMIINALLKNMEEKFGGQMAKMNKELSGQWEMLISIWQRFEMSIMNSGLYDLLTTSLTDINEKIIELRKTGKLDEWAKEIGDKISAIVKAFNWLVTDGINITISAVKVLTGWLIHKSFTAFLTWTRFATVGVGKVTTAVNLLRFSIKALGRAALYGLITEGILQVMSEFRRMSKFVKETPATWGTAIRLAMDNVVNTVIDSFVALGNLIPNLLHMLTDPIIAAFTSFNILDLIFGDLTKEQAYTAVLSSMETAFKNAFARIGDTFQVDMSRRIVHIASDADRLLLKNWLNLPKPGVAGGVNTAGVAGGVNTAGVAGGVNTAGVAGVGDSKETIDVYKKLIKQLEFEKSLLGKNESVQRAMTLARQNDIEIGSEQYDVILKLVTAYNTEAQRIAETKQAEMQRIAETKRIQEKRLLSIQDFNTQYADLGRSQFELDKQHVQDQAALWREAAETTITNENELATKKIEIAEWTSAKIKQIKQAETTEVMGMYANMAGQVSGIFMQIAQAGGEQSKKAFMMYKAFAMVQAGISGAQAYLLALGDPTVPATTARLILANVILGVTAAQIGMIAAAQPPSYDEGGISHARGIYQTGDIDEAHIPLKGGRIPVKMEKQEEKAPVEVTILNAFDPTMIDEYMHSSQGQSAILNVIGNRSQTVRRILR